MQMMKAILTALLGSLALGSVGCSLQIDQIFEMQEGSGVDVALVSLDGQYELPMGRLAFQGGTVMRITTSATLLDYIDGTVDGDVEIVDLLFAVPNMKFLILNMGLVCVVLDDPPGGGTFTYDVLAQEAAFDVLVNTKAIITQAAYAQLIQGGAFKFPFDLQAAIPLTLVDALGLFTGTGSLEVTQALDAFYVVPYTPNIWDPSIVRPLTIHVVGEVTLNSTDAFPATPDVVGCLDALSS
jgi:hypothetical protein